MELLKNRREAGKLLARHLSDLEGKVCVLALPRGGVPVGYEIARALGAPLDLLMVKKIGAPGAPEFAIGAVSEDNQVHWRQRLIEEMKIPKPKLEELAEGKQGELREQLKKWRPEKNIREFSGWTVIVVDDGLATGATMAAALGFLRRRNPKRIVVAAPVASQTARRLIRPLCDELIILSEPEGFYSVGQWYEDFTQVTDEEVRNLLHEFDDGDEKPAQIPAGQAVLEGSLVLPAGAKGLVLFAHGSGSSRKSPRNRHVAEALNREGFATLLFDLLTPTEAKDRRLVFDIHLLAERLSAALKWARTQSKLAPLPIGLFGASTGAAAALGAAAREPAVRAVVSRGGRPDLAGEYLKDVQAKVLLIVGGNDAEVLELNAQAKTELRRCDLVIVPGAGHLFEEGNTLDQVIQHAARWFSETLRTAPTEQSPTGARKQANGDLQL